MPVLIKFSFMHSTALVGNLPHEKAGLTPPLPPPLLSPVFPCEPNTVCNLTANWSCSWGLMNFLSAWQDLHGRHMTTHYKIRITQLTQRTRHSTQTTGTNETHSVVGGGGGWWVSAWTGIPADHLSVGSPLPLSPAQPPAEEGSQQSRSTAWESSTANIQPPVFHNQPGPHCAMNRKKEENGLTMPHHSTTLCTQRRRLHWQAGGQAGASQPATHTSQIPKMHSHERTGRREENGKMEYNLIIYSRFCWLWGYDAELHWLWCSLRHWSSRPFLPQHTSLLTSRCGSFGSLECMIPT